MSQSDPSCPTLYIVDDEPAVRHALRLLFSSVGMPVEEFASGKAFLERAQSGLCGCLVTDLRMPVLGGIDLIHALREAGCMLPAIVISGHGDVRLAVRALKAGAHDFVEKPFNDQDLIDAVNNALSAAAPAAGGAGDDLRARFAALTPREAAVLQGVIHGLANKQIARDLNVSPRTVEAHRAHLMEKLAVASVAELVALAVRAGVAGEPVEAQGIGPAATGVRSRRMQNE